MPDELWELFQRVVPEAPVRPQGGGRRRYGDREVLAAILFVATTGCTWRQLPPVLGPSGPAAHRRFTERSRARVWGKLHTHSRIVAPALMTQPAGEFSLQATKRDDLQGEGAPVALKAADRVTA